MQVPRSEALSKNHHDNNDPRHGRALESPRPKRNAVRKPDKPNNSLVSLGVAVTGDGRRWTNYAEVRTLMACVRFDGLDSSRRLCDESRRFCKLMYARTSFNAPDLPEHRSSVQVNVCQIDNLTETSMSVVY